ncbi:hypothetical protein BJV78DRAFT_1140182, partial [Lactifluus subvellereus]
PVLFNIYLGPERFQVGELFFAHSRNLVVSIEFAPAMHPAVISQHWRRAIQDMRQVLMGNVILAGSGSSFVGLGEGLNNELVRNL